MHSDKNCIPFALRKVHTLEVRMVASSQGYAFITLFLRKGDHMVAVHKAIFFPRRSEELPRLLSHFDLFGQVLASFTVQLVILPGCRCFAFTC